MIALWDKHPEVKMAFVCLISFKENQLGFRSLNANTATRNLLHPSINKQHPLALSPAETDFHISNQSVNNFH